MAKNTLEKSYQKKSKSLDGSKLIQIKPGNYMMFSKNKMKRILEHSQGLDLGPRIEDDNHRVVLIDEDLILIPKNGT